MSNDENPLRYGSPRNDSGKAPRRTAGRGRLGGNPSTARTSPCKGCPYPPECGIFHMQRWHAFPPVDSEMSHVLSRQIEKVSSHLLYGTPRIRPCWSGPGIDPYGDRECDSSRNARTPGGA